MTNDQSGRGDGDLAGRDYWDDIYANAHAPAKPWAPANYEGMALDRQMDAAIRQASAKSILEVGCGNSNWLPYLARRHNMSVVAGMDYSKGGCDMAASRLNEAGVQGDIHCGDLWSVGADEIGTYDFVYSLGLVEHFEDTAGCVGELAKFVAPGGVLFTSVPNLHRSIHGLIMRLWHPKVWRRHQPLDMRHLTEAYESIGLVDVCSQHVGLASLGVVSWTVEPRFPFAAKVVAPAVSLCAQSLSFLLARMGVYRPCPPLAPYVVAIGSKPA